MEDGLFKLSNRPPCAMASFNSNSMVQHTVISDQFPGGRSNQDLSCFCQIIGNAQFDKGACQQELPAVEDAAHMCSGDLALLTASLRYRLASSAL